MFPLLAYVKFLLRATNQHGVHSPFVFELVTKCFYNKRQFQEYERIKKYRQRLLKNKETIQVTDFGSGSRVFKSNKRMVAKIAKKAGISQKRAKLLFRVVRYLNCENILEIGTSLGIGTIALSGNKNASVTTLEGCPNTAKIAQRSFNFFNINNTKLLEGPFEVTLPQINMHPFDLIYFDGNHNKAATLDYFNQFIEHIPYNSIFVFDDIHWSKDMEDAWETLKKHPKISITIDTFYQGFVFFRKENREKEHFNIRL
jgi:predicted O-methyltransferase YrrM